MIEVDYRFCNNCREFTKGHDTKCFTCSFHGRTPLVGVRWIQEYKVKEAIERWKEHIPMREGFASYLKKELGFDGIENSSTEGTDVPSWSDKDDEVQP